MGILFDVNDKLGSGHKESYYEKAVEIAFREAGISYKRQLYMPLMYKNIIVGKQFFDFLVEEKIIVELKSGNQFTKKNIEQVYEYLKTANLKLGIIAQFSSNGVKYKRIVNIR